MQNTQPLFVYCLPFTIQCSKSLNNQRNLLLSLAAIKNEKISCERAMTNNTRSFSIYFFLYLSLSLSSALHTSFGVSRCCCYYYCCWCMMLLWTLLSYDICIYLCHFYSEAYQTRRQCVVTILVFICLHTHKHADRFHRWRPHQQRAISMLNKHVKNYFSMILHFIFPFVSLFLLPFVNTRMRLLLYFSPFYLRVVIFFCYEKCFNCQVREGAHAFSICVMWLSAMTHSFKVMHWILRCSLARALSVLAVWLLLLYIFPNVFCAMCFFFFFFLEDCFDTKIVCFWEKERSELSSVQPNNWK